MMTDSDECTFLNKTRHLKQHFSSWLGNTKGRDGITSFRDLAQSVTEDIGQIVDVFTIRVPKTMPTVGEDLYLSLANNIIIHAIELFGTDVFFSSHSNATLSISRFFNDAVLSINLRFGKDGEMLRIAIHCTIVNIINGSGESMEKYLHDPRFFPMSRRRQVATKTFSWLLCCAAAAILSLALWDSNLTTETDAIAIASSASLIFCIVATIFLDFQSKKHMQERMDTLRSLAFRAEQEPAINVNSLLTIRHEYRNMLSNIMEYISHLRSVMQSACD